MYLVREWDRSGHVIFRGVIMSTSSTQSDSRSSSDSSSDNEEQTHKDIQVGQVEGIKEKQETDEESLQVEIQQTRPQENVAELHHQNGEEIPLLETILNESAAQEQSTPRKLDKGIPVQNTRMNGDEPSPVEESEPAQVAPESKTESSTTKKEKDKANKHKKRSEKTKSMKEERHRSNHKRRSSSSSTSSIGTNVPSESNAKSDKENARNSTPDSGALNNFIKLEPQEDKTVSEAKEMPVQHSYKVDAVKRDKNMRPVELPARPKTAKPGRSRHNRVASSSSVTSTDTMQEEDSKLKNKSRRRKTKVLHSSSASTVSTFDEDSSYCDRNASMELLEFRKNKVRELLFHRYLDRHLEEKLDQHRPYFERGHSRGDNLKSRVRKRRSRRGLNRESTAASLARSAYSKKPFVLNDNSHTPREAEVKRHIKRLVAELSKYQSFGDVSAFKLSRETIEGKPPRPKSSRHEVKIARRAASSSDTTTSDENYPVERGGKSPAVVNEPTKQVKVVLPSEDQSPPNSARKSILKAEEPRRDRNKHVRMAEAENSGKTSYHSTPIGQFPYTMLSALLNSMNDKEYIMADKHGVLHQVTLRPAPIRPKTTPPRRPLTAHSRRTRNPKDGTPHIEDVNEKATNKPTRPMTAKTRSNKMEDTGKASKSEIKNSPRITPGIEPIKCNWDPEKSTLQKKEPRASDHQLKNTDNSSVLEWLNRKNVQARQQRIYTVRQNRNKRDKLMREYNERESHRESALVEYEKWKKRKNKEILLRRRRETLEANGARTEKHVEISKTVADMQSASPTDLRPKDSSLTSFADLRSSAIVTQLPPSPPKSGLTKDGIRRRPKSAPTKVSFGTPIATNAMKRDGSSSKNFIPVKIDFEKGDVMLLTPREEADISNLSAREPMMQSRPEENSNNFIRELLEERGTKSLDTNSLGTKSQGAKSMFEVPPPGTFTKEEFDRRDASDMDGKRDSEHDANAAAREHYNNWMRSNGTSSPYRMKSKKNSKRGKSNEKTTHDPLTNELLSDLAKRRIRKILDQKKRVDSGLKKNRPENEAPSPAKRNSESGGDSLKRWRLKEDLLVDEKGEMTTKKNKNSNSERKNRPTFSYDKKTKSKSVFHERNRAVNQALNT